VYTEIDIFIYFILFWYWY